MHGSVKGAEVCLFLFTLMFLFISTDALSEDVEIVRNRLKPAVNANPSLHFELKEDLTIGGEEGREGEVFGKVSGVAVDTLRNIYILDYDNCQIHVYDRYGDFLYSFGRRGHGPGEFSFPSAITINDHDQLIVADMNELQVFDVWGHYITSIRISNSSIIRSIAVDKEDNHYLSSFDVLEQNIIHKYNAEGEYVASFCKSFAEGEYIDLRIESTFAGGSIDIDDKDVIYFTQMLPYEIRKYTPEGSLLRQVYRENRFMKSPREYTKIDGDRMEFTLPVFSSSILVLSNDFVINVVHNTSRSESPSTSILDVFDAEGRLLTSKVMDRPIKLACRDDQSMIYAIDNADFPKVIRYRVSFESDVSRVMSLDQK